MSAKLSVRAGAGERLANCSAQKRKTTSSESCYNKSANCAQLNLPTVFVQAEDSRVKFDIQ